MVKTKTAYIADGFCNCCRRCQLFCVKKENGGLYNVNKSCAHIFGWNVPKLAVPAVSPAVIVPKMLGLMEKGLGVKKSIPQMILAGASVDDVFVIVMFTVFTGIAEGGSRGSVICAGGGNG